jgi:hypothetical protein
MQLMSLKVSAGDPVAGDDVVIGHGVVLVAVDARKDDL